MVIAFFIINVTASRKNKQSFAYAVYLAAMFLLLVAALLYFTKFANYRFPVRFDYVLYLFMSTIRLSVADISIIYNLGMVCIMIANLIVVAQQCRLSAKKIAVLFLPAVFYFIFNLPETYRELYLYQNKFGLEKFVKILRYSVEILVYVYMAAPLTVLCKKFKETRLVKKKKNIFLNICMLAVMDFFITGFFFLGVFSPISNINISLFKLPSESIGINNFTLIPLSVLAALTIAMFFAIMSAPRVYTAFAKQKIIDRNMRHFNKSNYMLPHTYKNKFVLINKLAKLATDYGDDVPENVRDIVTRIADISEEAYTNIEKVFSAMKPITLIEGDVDIAECVNDAVKSAAVPSSIKLEIANDVPENTLISADKEHLCESLLNIILNCIDALDGRDEPTIRIHLYECEKHLFIEIYDNGCGIEKKDLKAIFNPLFSTKTGGKNYGMGLTYVKKVINAQLGDIYVKSVKNHYTMFRIVFPINDEVKE